jgi:hypothetical protein
MNKLTLISFLQLFFTLHAQSQTELDTVQIYWENGLLKYQSISCLTDTVMDENSVEPLLISTRNMEIWDRDGKQYLNGIDDFIKNYGDIVDLDKAPCKGEDESIYRLLISKADSCFKKMDGTAEATNTAIRSYVIAKNMIAEASYPKMKLEEIDKLVKNKPNLPKK